MEFKIKLADVPVMVKSQYDTLKEYCKDYVIEDCEEPEITVEITPDDIERERNHDDTSETYTSQYLETLALLRLTSDKLADRDCFLMHGAVIGYHGGAYMFTAPSGTGKSTHISLWRKHIGQDVQIINGDKPFVKVQEPDEADKNLEPGGCVRVYGTPWAGKEHWQRNTSEVLKGICILARGKTNEIRRMRPGEAVVSLLRQIHFTDDADHAGRILELADQMIQQVPVWELRCDMSEEAVRTSYEAMTGEKYI